MDDPTPRYSKLVRLEADHAPQVEALCVACTDFYLETTGAPPGPSETQGFLDDVPPHGDRAQRRLWLAFIDDRLVGVIDCVFGHPAPGDFWIGLLMLHPEARGRGLGADIVAALADYARAHGSKRLGIGVKADYRAAQLFWRAQGFVPIREQTLDLPGLGSVSFDVMLLELSGVKTI